METIAETQAEDREAAERQITIPTESVPPAVVGRALTSGSNKQHSIERIVAFFQKSPTGSAAATFMKNEFGEGGKGVNIAGQDYALWSSEKGLRIAPGRSAFGPGSTLVSWLDAAIQVNQLLNNGMFATQDKIDAAIDNEYRELSENLWYLRKDFSDEAVNRGFLSSIAETYHGGNFPESTARIAEQLENSASRQEIAKELGVFWVEADRDPTLLRSRQHPDEKKLFADVVNLFQERQEFRAVEGFAPTTGKFVTEDEIDRLFIRDNGVSETKLRIYAYFMQGHNAGECAAFLRNGQSVGGHCYTGYDEWHDGKGIRLSRSDEFSAGNYDTVSLNWNQVQKRIRKLIDDGRYLNSAEKNALPEYETRQLARRICSFYRNDPNKVNPPGDDLDAAEKKVLAVLTADDPEKEAELFHEMFSIMAAVPPDSREYQLMAPVLRDMEAFKRDEYSLFAPLPESVLEDERQRKRNQKQTKQAASKTERESIAQQGPTDDLAALARTLASKRKTAPKEQDDGQFSLFSMPDEDRPAEDTPPPAKEPKQEPAVSPAPLWEEYKAFKDSCPDSMVLFQVGDFFEIYGEDAKKAAALLDLTLTTRPIAGAGCVEMCGIPAHSLERYLEKLCGQYDVTVSAVDAKTGERQTRTMPLSPSQDGDSIPNNFEFEYRRLSVLKSDCEYFLGAGGRAEKHLSEGSIAAQISKMRELYDAVAEKPEWLTAADIDRHEAQMQAGAIETTAPNYEATVTAEEAPLLVRFMADRGINPARFDHDNGDVTFSFAESEWDAAERLITKLRTELSKAVASTYPSDQPPKAGRTRPG